MKSLMQEASSFLKAIEKAWIAAGQPKEFMIKIYENAEHNFIGMTTKPAKIGIFFGESFDIKQAQPPRVRETRSVHVEERATEHKEYPERRVPKRKESTRFSQIWSTHMVEYVKNWLQGALDAMQSDVSFTIEPQNYYLRCVFEKPLLPTPEQERMLFRNFALLILQSLKKELHRPLRGFKVVLRSK